MDPMKNDDISTSSNGDNNQQSDDSSRTSGTSKGTQDASSVTSRVVLGQRESTLVWRSRMAVLLVLLVATISVSILTYKFTEGEEQEDFKTRVSIFRPRTLNLYCSSRSNHSYDFAASTIYIVRRFCTRGDCCIATQCHSYL
jgi:hypothetical protein